MKNKLLVITALIVCVVYSFNLNTKPKNYGSVRVLEVTSIYDADTFRVNIEGWPSIIGEHVSIRINDIDAPELVGKSFKVVF